MSRANVSVRLCGLIMIYLFVSAHARAQTETVPVSHPAYRFLKRMEVKGVLERYNDAMVPLSRRSIADFLTKLRERGGELTQVERDILRDFFVEFEYDITGQTQNHHVLIGSSESGVGENLEDFFSEKEKFLYVYADTNLSLFVDGLLTWDARRSTGDALGSANATFIQFGGRIRGTVSNHFGYFLQATNAQFYGSRDVLRRDNLISQAYTLNILDAQNFDFVEGYARYDTDILSMQVGRERMLWGNGFGDKLILSDNVRVFDFIRGDAQYKSVKYSFVHAWLLGKGSTQKFSLPSDTSFKFSEPVNADKYFAAHRLELSFPELFDVGFQEMVIYSNRSPDLAYLNPFTLLESAQRSREERDNVLWALDIQGHFVRGLEIQGSILFDDINFPKWGTNAVQNKYAFQVGGMLTDPAGLSNVSLAVEYTRIEPYTFSHDRSRDNDYGSLGRILGHHIGSNADSWFFRLDYFFSRKLFTTLRFELQREGNNIYDAATDTLISNVGGDFLQPHRSGRDSDTKEFLGGNLVKTYRVQAFVTYEIVNEIFFDLRYEMRRRTDSLAGTRTTDHDYGLALRIDF